MLEGLEPLRHGNAFCKVERTASELSPEDAKILWAAIDDPKTWSAKGLEKALAQRGLRITDGVITRHRNKACWCYRSIG